MTFEYPTLTELTAHVRDLLDDRVQLIPRAEPPAAAVDELAELTADELADAPRRELDDAGY
jgi:hypothetical protein